jgi:hypothetical protein
MLALPPRVDAASARPATPAGSALTCALDK